eukprot:2556994-Amphidinium_carterae.2
MASSSNQHFHDFSIITTEQALSEDYAIHMIKHYYSELQRNNPDPPPYKQYVTALKAMNQTYDQQTL